MEQVTVDCEMTSFFFVFHVGDAGAVIDGPSARSGARREEKGVGKARLARRPMSSEGDVPDIGNMIRRGHGA
jgi:hypothetical protein